MPVGVVPTETGLGITTGLPPLRLMNSTLFVPASATAATPKASSTAMALGVAAPVRGSRVAVLGGLLRAIVGEDRETGDSGGWRSVVVDNADREQTRSGQRRVY